MKETARVAELEYSKDRGIVQLSVPEGLKTAEVARLKDLVFTDLVARLPRGCQACLSGESLIIRERLENVLRIDLDTMKVLG
ncbi:MAG: hypothetical protein R2991_14270 [Thermoanaerobaculia bacterium]